MRRVLLVDDEPNLRRLLAMVLRNGGLEVTEASHSAEALAFAETNELDVLVTDVCLEHVDGPTLASAIAKKNPSLLVVFISGYRMEAEAEQWSREHPYSAFLMKPFPPKNLLKVIADLVERQERSRL